MQNFGWSGGGWWARTTVKAFTLAAFLGNGKRSCFSATTFLL